MSNPTGGAVRVCEERRQLLDFGRAHAENRRRHGHRRLRRHGTGSAINELSADVLLEVGVDITDHTQKQLTDDLIRSVDRVIVLGRDAHVEPGDGT